MRTPLRRRPATAIGYAERVNLAIDYVVGHLGEPLRLADVARAAHLSAFHFHRVFQAQVGETLAEFVKRLRLERALVMMAHAPRSSLTTIALKSGFSSSSDFSRCFRQRYGTAPSTFDLDKWREVHGSELKSKVRGPAAHNPEGFKVRIRELPARKVAYIRVLNPYRGDTVARATRRLMAWAERHSLADGQWLGYQWDNPEITSLEDCHYYVAVEAERFVSRGEIGRFLFPRMIVAEVEIRGAIDLELRALQWLYGTWLPKSGYVPDDQPGFEAWIGRPFAHGTEYFELYAQLPIVRE